MNINKYSFEFRILIILNVYNKVDGICREGQKEGKREVNEEQFIDLEIKNVSYYRQND